MIREPLLPSQITNDRLERELTNFRDTEKERRRVFREAREGAPSDLNLLTLVGAASESAPNYKMNNTLHNDHSRRNSDFLQVP